MTRLFVLARQITPEILAIWKRKKRRKTINRIWKRKIITKMGKSNIYTNKKTAEFAESNQKPMTTNQKPLEY
jgi:hypothetical protein